MALTGQRRPGRRNLEGKNLPARNIHEKWAKRPAFLVSRFEFLGENGRVRGEPSDSRHPRPSPIHLSHQKLRFSKGLVPTTFEPWTALGRFGPSEWSCWGGPWSPSLEDRPGAAWKNNGATSLHRHSSLFWVGILWAYRTTSGPCCPVPAQPQPTAPPSTSHNLTAASAHPSHGSMASAA